MGKRRRSSAAHDEVHDQRRGHFSIVPHEFIRGYGAQIKPHGVSVYLALLSFVNAKDQSCYPSFQTLAAMTGMSRRQVMRSINTLEQLGLIAVHRRRATDTNIYTILDLPSPVIPPPS